MEEVNKKFRDLSKLLNKQKTHLTVLKTLASEVSAVKLTDPADLQTPLPDTAELKAMLIEAKEASEKYGSDSIQAKLAWEAVEEVASNDNSQVMKPSFAEECLVEAIEACEAIEELQVALVNRGLVGGDP